MKYPSLQDRPNECDELDGEEERTKRLSNEYQDVSRCVKMPAKTPLDFQFETLQSVLKHELSRISYFGSRQDLNYQDAVKFGLKSGEVGQHVGRWSEQSICFCKN